MSLLLAALMTVIPIGGTPPKPPAPPLDLYPPEVVADLVIHSIVLQARSDAAEAIVQQVEADEATEALRAAQRPVEVLVATPGPTRIGGHSDAWWMGVAVCEQGGRNDPYFGYFSFMDGSMGGQPWAVQVAAGNALLASVGSESPAWAPACVAAGYAASPSG